MKRPVFFTFSILILLFAGNLFAQNKEVLSARESDPANFGWMQGFPPGKDKVLSAADGSFFRFPALRWSVVNMRQFLPTMNVSRGIANPVPLRHDMDEHIDSILFTPIGEDDTMSWEESLWKNYTDGIIILHKGTVVYERYFGALTEQKQHAVMSLTKSVTGTLGAMLVAEGVLDENRLVSEYIPELKNSAFGDATVRQVMDMTTGLQFSEDYANPKAEIWDFSAAGNPFPKPEGYTGAKGYYDYLKTVKKQGKHGKAFGYKTVNSDVLGWLIARAGGKSVAQLLEERIWSKLGMESDAYYQVDALGTPFAGGGLNAGLRDLARFGELIRNRGVWNGEQIIPSAAVEDIEKGGSQKAFAKAGYKLLKDWSYRDMWWMTENSHRAFSGRGVHGQAIYIDPAAEMVIVRLASHPVAANSANDPFSLPAYEAVAKYLIEKR